MTNRAVVHIDLDAFFASVEIKKRPELKGKPVIVGADGDPSKRGVVSAASYEARSFGVASGMPLKKAYKLCPEGVFLPVDFGSYERESERFMEIIREYSPLTESFGLDEAFVEVIADPGADPIAQAVEVAKDIKRRVKKDLGLTASAGVGPNKLIAKMASDMGKPDGLFAIRGEEIEKIFRDMPVRDLWGVGVKTGKRLNELGINTVGELSKVPVAHLDRNFGPITGRTLHDHASGIDNSPVVPFSEPESFGREVTFEEDTREAYTIKETLYILTGDVVARLKLSGYKGRKVAIKVRFNDFKTITREATFDNETDSLNDIWPAALKLLESVDLPRPVRLVGVRISKFTGSQPVSF
ncbi:MAG: DNA polymerase IV [Deltaproteobacteria bacterium]|nr:DNA polymerase IV [Deltaproteobacteria bacterium]